MHPLVLLALLIAGQGQPPSTEQIFLSAQKALQSNQLSAAESGFREVLRREPKNIAALGNLGVVYSRQGRHLQAVTVYTAARKLAPTEPNLILNLGLAYLKLDDYAQAKPLFAQLSTPQARELHAICQLQTGEVAAATAALEALAAKPSPAVLHFLSLAYAKQNRLPDAQLTLDRLFASLPQAQAHFLEGKVWYEAALFDKALASFEKAFQSNPTLSGLARETGKTHISLHNDDAALQQLRRALAFDPDDIEAKYFLGAFLVQQSTPAEAIPLLQAVQDARPDLWGTFYYLGKAQLSQGKASLALPLLQQAATRVPNDTSVQYQLARTLQALGRKAEAAQAFARLSKLRAQSVPEQIQLK
jgi:Flp pilus assembly protein TadD